MFTSVRSLNSSSLFEVSCKNPAKNIGNLESRDTFLRMSFPRFSRVVAFKLSDQCQMMSILEQPSRSLSSVFLVGNLVQCYNATAYDWCLLVDVSLQ